MEVKSHTFNAMEQKKQFLIVNLASVAILDVKLLLLYAKVWRFHVAYYSYGALKLAAPIPEHYYRIHSYCIDIKL